MSPCSHWHWCLSLRRSRSATNTLIPANVELFELVMWYFTVIQPQLQSKLFCWLTNVAVSSHASHSSLSLFPFSLRRGTSPCLWTVWRCWGSWEKGWVGLPQLEWSEDEGPHEVVEVKTEDKTNPPILPLEEKQQQQEQHWFNLSALMINPQPLALKLTWVQQQQKCCLNSWLKLQWQLSRETKTVYSSQPLKCLFPPFLPPSWCSTLPLGLSK